MLRSEQHEAGARVANLRARHQRPDVFSFRMFTAQLEAMTDGLEAHFLAALAAIDTLLQLVAHLMWHNSLSLLGIEDSSERDEASTVPEIPCASALRSDCRPQRGRRHQQRLRHGRPRPALTWVNSPGRYNSVMDVLEDRTPVSTLLENQRAFLRYLERHVGDASLAEDILQDALAKVVARPEHAPRDEAVVRGFIERCTTPLSISFVGAVLPNALLRRLRESPTVTSRCQPNRRPTFARACRGWPRR
jgi:hypothetical protein